MNSHEAVGNQVRAARLAAKMSQAELAKAVGLSQAAIWGVESGERKLTYLEGRALRVLIGFDAGEVEASIARDAFAYRRILATVTEREADYGVTMRVVAS